MRWFHAGLGVLALLVSTGCPSEFGKDGRVDRAIHKDSLEISRKYCSEEKRQKFCGHGKQNTEACRRECGE